MINVKLLLTLTTLVLKGVFHLGKTRGSHEQWSEGDTYTGTLRQIKIKLAHL